MFSRFGARLFADPDRLREIPAGAGFVDSAAAAEDGKAGSGWMRRPGW